MAHDIVVFDIADGDFRFYSSQAWAVNMSQWRESLKSVLPTEESLDEEEVFDLYWGDECYFTEVPTNI